jgi:intraflagellar transport protein 88
MQLFIHPQGLYKGKKILPRSNCNDVHLCEAIFNLGLTNTRLGKLEDAMQSFVKLHTVSLNNLRVLYQVAILYEEVDVLSKASKWFNMLSATIPTDPGVIFLHTNNESQRFHYHLESFRCYPSIMDMIG